MMRVFIVAIISICFMTSCSSSNKSGTAKNIERTSESSVESPDLEIKLDKSVYKKGENVTGRYINHSKKALYFSDSCVSNFEVKNGKDWKPTAYATHLSKNETQFTHSKQESKCTPCKNVMGFARIGSGESKPLNLPDQEITLSKIKLDTTKVYRVVAFIAPQESCDSVAKVVSSELKYGP